MANTTLILDLGNSSTKAIVVYEGAKRVEKVLELPNAFALLPSGYHLSRDYTEDTSSILYINTKVDLGNDIASELNGYYCNGDLQVRERPDSIIKPSARVNKWLLQSTPLSLHLVFLRAIKSIMTEVGVTDPKELNLVWKVVTLLPPGDYLNGKEAYASLIKSVTKVVGFLPKLQADINIEVVKVFPEGFGSYVSVVYADSTTLREGFEYLATSSVLIVDIGGGTTDIIVIKDNKVIQDSKFTIGLGGNNVRQLVYNNLLSDGLLLDDNTLNEGILQGYVMDGAKKKDITKLVAYARSEVSNKIVSAFNAYLEGTAIKMRSIGYVLFCGGGSIKTQGRVSMVDNIAANIKALAPNCEIVTPPKMVVGGQSMNTAMMNVVGAYILSGLL